jgi:RHS repeat-associated protein
MKTKISLLRAGAVLSALLAAISVTSSGKAQPAQAHRQPDGNGVDVTYGDFLLAFTEGSIGSGQGQLSLVRTGVWDASANLNGHQWDWIAFQRTPHTGASDTYAVNIHGRSEVFTGTGTLPSGSSLSGSGNDFVYHTADGTTIEFTDDGQGGWGTDSNFCTGDTAQGSCVLVPTTITQPNGRTLNIAYDIWTHCWDLIDSEHLPCHFTPRISSVANSFGYEIHFAYNSSGSSGSGDPSSSWFQRTGATFHNATISGNPSQASVSYSYPSTGVTEVTDAGGNVWRFSGSLSGVSGIRRPGATSDTTSISYSAGSIVSSVTREGVSTSYSRSVSGSTATETITDAASHVTTVVSNLTLGRPTSVTDPLSHQTQYQYDSYGRVTRVTLPEGNYTAFTYDARGNVTETRRVAKSGTGLADMVTSATYPSACGDPSCNEPSTTTDERGNVTDYTYDTTHGGVTSVLGPPPTSGAVRPETRYSYALTNGEYLLTEISACATGSTSSPSCVGTSDESRSVFGYDANGNLTSVERRSGNPTGTGALSATVTATYDPLGNLLTVDGPLSGSADTTRYRYNAARQLVGVVGPDPDGAGAHVPQAQRITYTYGLPTRTEIGTVASQTDTDWAAFSSTQQSDTTFNSDAQPTRRTVSSGGTTYAVTDMSYDSLGRPDCTAVRMNSSAWGTVTAACTLQTAGTYGNDRITRATYNNAGQVVLVQTGYGVTGVQADEVATTYRDNGQIETVTDPEGNRTTHVYDGHDRLSQTQYPSTTRGAGSSNTSDYEQFTYASASIGGSTTVSTPFVASGRLRDGTYIGFTYDALGRMTHKDLPGSDPDADYSYDNFGRVTSAVFTTTGHGVSNTFDALGRLTSTSSDMDGTTRTLSYQYDLAGNRTQITHPDSAYFTYNYDVLGRVTLIRESGVNWLDGFSFNDAGAITDQSYDGTWVSSSGFDALGRRNAVTHNLAGTSRDVSLTFTYTPVSQLASRTQSNDAYAWTDHYLIDRSYVADGLNRYSTITPAGGSALTLTYDGNRNLTSDGSTTFAYDSESHLISASGAHSATLSYDPLGRLWQVTSGSNTTRFLYDGDALIAEYDGTGAMTHRYVFGPGNTPEVAYDGTSLSAPRYLIADERGSIVALADSSGATPAINTYDEHGIPGASNSGRFRYTGQAWLSELGIYYYRARFYSPTLGRFLQTDPAGYGGGMNLYAYTGGDPINFSDPSGMQCYKTDYDDWSKGGEYISASGAETFCSGGGWDLYGSYMGMFGASSLSSPLFYGGGGGGQADSTSCANGGTNALSHGLGVSAADVSRAGSTGEAVEALQEIAAIVRAIEASPLFLTLLLSSDTPEPQYVVRNGVATAQQLIGGTSRFPRDGEWLTGFSVNTAPFMTWQDIAHNSPSSYGYRQVSVTTVQQLANIGVRVLATNSRGQPLHATVLTPYPLSPAVAALISAQFHARPNPAYCGR